jgi:hypothetical protein
VISYPTATANKNLDADGGVGIDSAQDNAAEIAVTPGWSVDGAWVSSKSREWPNVALSRDAICGGYWVPLVKTVQAVGEFTGGDNAVMALTIAGVLGAESAAAAVIPMKSNRSSVVLVRISDVSMDVEAFATKSAKMFVTGSELARPGLLEYLVDPLVCAAPLVSEWSPFTA